MDKKCPLTGGKEAVFDTFQIYDYCCTAEKEKTIMMGGQEFVVNVNTCLKCRDYKKTT